MRSMMSTERSLACLLLVVTACLCDDRSAATGSAESVLWGTYRPGQYAGVRALHPDSPLFGIMFNDATMLDGYDHIRHDCDDRDQMFGFGYKFHDGIQAGVQQLPDQFTGVSLTTSFLNMTDHSGSGWVMRISGEALPTSQLKTLNLFWYFTLNSNNHSMSPTRELDGSYTKCFRGDFGDIGKYDIGVVSSDNSHPSISYGHRMRQKALKQPLLGSNMLPKDSHWDVKGHLIQSLKTSLQTKLQQRLNLLELSYKMTNSGGMPSRADMIQEILDDEQMFMLLDDEVDGDDTVFYSQHVVNVPFQIDILCVPVQDIDDNDVKPGTNRHPVLSNPNIVSSSLASAKANFDSNFESQFQLSGKGFNDQAVTLAKEAVSDLMGSIGYFHGSSVHVNPETDSAELMQPSSLMTVVPARSFFPRGFLWDEGFHQLLLCRVNVDLSLKILQSWIDLIHENGWLPREQILGEEARVRVPAEFQPQHPLIANPPTLFIAIEQIVKLSSSSTNTQYSTQDAPDNVVKAKPVNDGPVLSFLRSAYPKLVTHFSWFLRTQVGSRDISYRWQQCTSGHCLASGFDDLPRPAVQLEQNHVDLHSWILYMGEALVRISRILGDDANEAEFQKICSKIAANLDEYHWDPTQNAFVDSYAPADSTGEFVFSTHIGYHSLLPFCLGQISPSSPKLQHILNQISNPEIFWTNFGITSLSKSDDLFGLGENYWRGPIWMNINFLVVKALYKYGFKDIGPYSGQAQKIYSELRTNLITNLVEQYELTGYLWEQYNPHDGKGQRSHPFTGWTALIVLIMAEQY